MIPPPLGMVYLSYFTPYFHQNQKNRLLLAYGLTKTFRVCRHQVAIVDKNLPVKEDEANPANAAEQGCSFTHSPQGDGSAAHRRCTQGPRIQGGKGHRIDALLFRQQQRVYVALFQLLHRLPGSTGGWQTMNDVFIG